MILKILKKEIERKKIIHLSLFLFILLPALLISSAAGLIGELSGAMSAFFDKAKVPHYVQLHAGNLEYEKVELWSRENPLIDEWQLVEMLNIDGSALFLGNGGISQADTIMDLGFIRQNRDFDYILDLDNLPVSVERGQIAVPLYFKEKETLRIGDKVQIRYNGFTMDFRISDFTRDAMMNPSIIHSKRFVLHKEDYDLLKKNLGEVEHLVEFRLKDEELIKEFGNLYDKARLPRAGQSINIDLFRVINGITDGITISIIVLISILFCIVAVLCLRFTILASLEEEYREIGVMKAIGIPSAYIGKIYLTKYTFIALLAVASGYLLSFMLNRVLNANILLYLGSVPKDFQTYLIPAIASFAVFAVVFLSCFAILRKFRSITAVEAIRSGRTSCKSKHVKLFSLGSARNMNPNIFLGLRDVVLRFRLFWLMGFIFFFSSFLIIVPVNFVKTIQSPTFIQYLGIGKSDIRIDLRYSSDIQMRYEQLIDALGSDSDVSLFAPMVTSQFKVKDSDGVFSNINIESGDYSLFPLNYVEGAAPAGQSEIALSLLNARDLDLQVGDSLEVFTENESRSLQISGIYQDITSGGYTAKTSMAPNENTILWYVVNVDLKETSSHAVQEKVQQFSQLFYPARVTYTSLYIKQTLGNTIDQLKVVTNLVVIVSLIVTMLITALFLKMILTKDSSQIAIMKGLGFSQSDITIQYVTRSIIMLLSGVALGTVAANTIGEKLISSIWSIMGASEIQLISDPLKSYIIFPLLLTASVTLITLKIVSMSKHASISEMNAE